MKRAREEESENPDHQRLQRMFYDMPGVAWIKDFSTILLHTDANDAIRLLATRLLLAKARVDGNRPDIVKMSSWLWTRVFVDAVDDIRSLALETLGFLASFDVTREALATLVKSKTVTGKSMSVPHERLPHLGSLVRALSCDKTLQTFPWLLETCKASVSFLKMSDPHVGDVLVAVQNMLCAPANMEPLWTSVCLLTSKVVTQPAPELRKAILGILRNVTCVLQGSARAACTQWIPLALRLMDVDYSPAFFGHGVDFFTCLAQCPESRANLEEHGVAKWLHALIQRYPHACDREKVAQLYAMLSEDRTLCRPLVEDLPILVGWGVGSSEPLMYASMVFVANLVKYGDVAAREPLVLSSMQRALDSHQDSTRMCWVLLRMAHVETSLGLVIATHIVRRHAKDTRLLDSALQFLVRRSWDMDLWTAGTILDRVIELLHGGPLLSKNVAQLAVKFVSMVACLASGKEPGLQECLMKAVGVLSKVSRQFHTCDDIVQNALACLHAQFTHATTEYQRRVILEALTPLLSLVTLDGPVILPFVQTICAHVHSGLLPCDAETSKILSVCMWKAGSVDLLRSIVYVLTKSNQPKFLMNACAAVVDFGKKHLDDISGSMDIHMLVTEFCERCASAYASVYAAGLLERVDPANWILLTRATSILAMLNVLKVPSVHLAESAMENLLSLSAHAVADPHIQISILQILFTQPSCCRVCLCVDAMVRAHPSNIDLLKHVITFHEMRLS